MTRVLVTGTDRPIGRAILPRLVKHDLIPVAVVGDPAGPIMTVDPDLIPDDKIDVEVDTHSNIGAALDGAIAVIHAADTRPGGSPDIPEAARAIAQACAERGIHMVFVSRVGCDVSSLAHRKRLWQAEQVVEQTPNLGYTIQRTTHSHPAAAKLFGGPWLPLPQAAPIQPVSPADVAGRVVGLAQVGPSQRVRDYGGPELMRFSELAHIFKQVRKAVPRKVPLPKVGVMSEALDGVHVTTTGDRGTETFRGWLAADPAN